MACGQHEDLTPTQYSVLSLVLGLGMLRLTQRSKLDATHPTMLSRILSTKRTTC